MNTIKGYGVIIRNTPIDEKNTVAYQELTTIGLYGEDAVIDIVRADSCLRPKLEHLIDTLTEGDRIDMYSVDTLLQGDSRKADEYYSAIISKGIDLLICDFSGAIARISPFSTLRFGDRFNGEDFFVKKNPPYDILIADFCEHIKNAKPEKNSGGMRTAVRLDLNNAFKEIYYAYESYQIDQPTTLALLKEYCGIENKITFWLMAQDYERTLSYADELDDYARIYPEILALPKRCGGLPDEYSEIENLATTLTDIPQRHIQIETAMRQLGFVAGYQVFKRWELVAQKKPKPRKPVPYNFNIEDFKKRYKTYNAK